MGLAGVTGPFRGAYCTVQFATPALVPGTPAVGATQMNIWTWNAPFDLEITEIQCCVASLSSGVRVNVLAGGASVLDNTINNATSQGVALGQSNQTFGVGGSVYLTPSLGVFAATATSITNTVTPSSPGNLVNRGKAYGAYVVAGATICATYSTPAGASGNITNLIGTIVFFPRTHPAGLRSGTE